MSTVHALLPGGVDNPLRPSGGNVYDRHVCRGLAAIGWSVCEHPLPGHWPRPDPVARAGLADVLEAIPDHGLVLVDGLVGSAVPEVIAPPAARLRIVVLLHMPLGPANPAARPAERAVLASAAGVVTTSRWTRQWLLDHYDLRSGRLQVAEPGVEVKSLAAGSAGGNRLLCVGAVAPHKGHDLLVAALAELSAIPWTCQVVGALDVAPGFAAEVRRAAQRHAIADRIQFLGPLTGARLEAAYTGSDVLVVPSRTETYGMVVIEALAHGLPVVATAVGGLPEALGRAAGNRRPGLLVRPDDASALATELRAYLTDHRLRRRLRQAVADRRGSLPLWSHTTARVARMLTDVRRFARR